MPRSNATDATARHGRSIPLIVILLTIFVSLFCAINFYLVVHLNNLDIIPNDIIPSLLHLGNDDGGAAKTYHDQNATIGYDVVTVVHHDDMETLIKHGLQSYVDWLIDFPSNARIYAICTQKAMDKLLELKKKEGAHDNHEQSQSNNVWSRVYPVNENIYPFNLTDIKNARSDKPTWNYQQLLKLYTHRALISKGYPVYRKFVVIDADTILTKPLYMEEPQMNAMQDRRPFACVASVSSGAFENDALVAGEKGVNWNLINEVLGDDFTKAYPQTESERFTAICHHMHFDGQYLNELLDYLEQRHSQKPWITLGSLQRSFLSEYELYLAWVMNRHRTSVAVRQLSYVNWGRGDSVTLGMAGKYGASYLTKHDDWGLRNICCVNSNWPEESVRELKALKPTTPPCLCCPARKQCEHRVIDCKVLGIGGCKDVSSSQAGPYMIFDEL